MINYELIGSLAFFLIIILFLIGWRIRVLNERAAKAQPVPQETQDDEEEEDEESDEE